MLRVRGLTMRYPNGKLALAGFDLSVEAGELVVVLGGNGSGKTTLLRCISRMLTPTAGRNLAQRHQSGRAFGRAAASGAPAAGDDLAACQPGAAAQRAEQCRLRVPSAVMAGCGRRSAACPRSNAAPPMII